MRGFSVDLLGVVAGIAAGVAAAVISRLLLGQEGPVIGGAVAAAAFVASAVTTVNLATRAKARRLCAAIANEQKATRLNQTRK